MKKVTNIIFIFIFCAVTSVLSYYTLFGEKEGYSYFENRNLATKPVAESDAIADGSYFSDLETYFADHAAGRRTLVKLSAWVDIKILHRPVVNDVVITDDILLPYNKFESVDLDAVNAEAAAIGANLEHLSKLTESYGGKYLYAGVPCQYAYFENKYPFYLENRSKFTDLSVEALTRELESRGVEFLDLGKVYEALGNPPELSSYVDNHFSIQGAYVAYREIINRLNEMSGEDKIHLVGEDELNFVKFSNYYIGSRTRKIFNIIKNDEKLYAAYPVNPIPFSRYTTSGGVGYPTVYKYYQSPYDWVTYDYYMGGDIADVVLDTSRPELPTILFYGDSFTNAAECIMYLSFDKTYALDMRHYREMSLSDFIITYKPDYVVCLRDYESLISIVCNGNK